MYSPHDKPEGPSWADFSLLLFRAGIAIALFLFHAVPELPTGWGAIWNQTAWPLADFVAAQGVPQARWLTAAMVVVALFSLTGLICGFLTRVSAALLLAGVVVFGISSVQESDIEGLERSILYGLALFYFFLRGAGLISADWYFSRKRVE